MTTIHGTYWTHNTRNMCKKCGVFSHPAWIGIEKSHKSTIHFQLRIKVHSVWMLNSKCEYYVDNGVHLCVCLCIVQSNKIIWIRFVGAHVSDKTWYRNRLLTYRFDCLLCILCLSNKSSFIFTKTRIKKSPILASIYFRSLHVIERVVINWSVIELGFPWIAPHIYYKQ